MKIRCTEKEWSVLHDWLMQNYNSNISYNYPDFIAWYIPHDGSENSILISGTFIGVGKEKTDMRTDNIDCLLKSLRKDKAI